MRARLVGRIGAAIVPVAPVSVRIRPVPAQAGVRRRRRDADRCRCQDRAENDAAKELAVIRLVLPSLDIDLILVPILVRVFLVPVGVIVPVAIPVLVPILVPVFAPVIVRVGAPGPVIFQTLVVG